MSRKTSAPCTDPSYRKMLMGYCAYIRQSFDFAMVNIDYNMAKRKGQQQKFALVMDFDGVFMGEGSCLDDEIFTCTIDFVQHIHHTYGNTLPIYIITARRRPEPIMDILRQLRMDSHIRAIYCDRKGLGTAMSKMQNRDRVRRDGYAILASIGDNVLDLQTENETAGYADTINVLLPNVWRQRSLREN